MPFYNHLQNWNGLEIKALPINPWRKRFPFWPFFIGQRVELALKVTKQNSLGKNDLNFHLVEKMADEEKPKMIALVPQPTSSSDREKVFHLQNGSRITSQGEIRYWLSNRGYNVDNEPIFTAEAVCMDDLILPLLVAIIGPLLGFILGLIIGLLAAG
jgi:hypothetical protein